MAQVGLLARIQFMVFSKDLVWTSRQQAGVSPTIWIADRQRLTDNQRSQGVSTFKA